MPSKLSVKLEQHAGVTRSMDISRSMQHTAMRFAAVHGTPGGVDARTTGQAARKQANRIALRRRDVAPQSEREQSFERSMRSKTAPSSPAQSPRNSVVLSEDELSKSENKALLRQFARAHGIALPTKVQGKKRTTGGVDARTTGQAARMQAKCKKEPFSSPRSSDYYVPGKQFLATPESKDQLMGDSSQQMWQMGLRPKIQILRKNATFA